MLTINLEIPEELQNKLFTKLKKEKINSSQYFINLLENDLNSTINLGEGFYYNEYLGKLFNPDEKEILLTKIEKELLLTLISANTDIVSAEELMQKAWKRDDISIFTFRNMIKKIRDKTYYEMIKNHSNRGYSLKIQ